MTKQVDKFGVTLKKLASTVAMAFGTAAIINFGKESVKAASALNDAWMGLESIVAGQGKSFSKAKAFINDYISDGLVPLENAVTAYKNLAARGYSTEQIEKTLTALKDAAAFGRQASYSLGDAVSSATEGLKNENSILVDNAGVTKNVAKMWDDYAKSIGTTANNLTQAQKIQAEVNGILEETRFQTGDAAKLVNTYSGQLAMLGYNFQQLKVAVGNALIPIAQAVLPGINAIIAAFTKLANVFAKVTAMLFGKSTQVKATTGVESSATGAADATDKLAESTEGVGEASKKAAKDMKGAQAGFDELNILAGKAASSMEDAAGGIGDVGGAGDFDIPEFEADTGNFEEFEKEFSSLGELFVDTLDKMLAAMPAFRDALLNFADNFNEFNQKLYDAFTFPGVKERVEELGRELAESFNDLVNAIDWELWGRTLGAGLNLGLQFLTEFLYTFDWIRLGEQLAAFINGLVYEVDWYDFGRLLWAKFKLALETFAGFILGLDMPALAQAASDIIMGFFNSMQETIAKIDWAAIGRQIAEFLNNIDWAGVISSIANAIGAMIPAALELIGGFIQNADTGTLIAAALFLGSKLLPLLLGKVISPIAKQIGSDLIKQIAAAITGGESGSLLASISGIFSKIASSVGPVLVAIGKVSLVIGGVVTAALAFFDMWNDGFSWAKEAVMLVGIAIAAVGAALLGVNPVVAAVVAAIVAVLATVVAAWDEIAAAASAAKDFIVEKWNDFWDLVDTEIIQPLSEGWNNFWSNLSQWASDTRSSVQNVWNGTCEWFETKIVKPLSGAWDKFWSTLKQLASDTWSNIQEVWNAASSWFNDNIIEPIKELFSGLFDGIKKFANDTIENIKKIFSGIIDFLTGVFTGDWERAWNGIKNIFDGIINQIKNIFQGAFDFISGLIGGIVNFVEKAAKAVGNFATGATSGSSKISGGTRSGGRYSSAAYSLPDTTSYNLPRLANGAVIPPNQQFAAILGDQRSGVNIEAPLSTIEQALANVLSRNGGAIGTTEVNVNFTGSLSELARILQPAITVETKRVGTNLVGVRT